ncbi:CTP synthase [Eubacterium coprostanoligenes]|uniref:CTP synthase n=1 Tax=Eubacterium coprostanoligenes TaxID=290054 RepID=UPI002357A6B4|nr:CTP synthase [Eubacterium coprostanoligenes]MCI6254399.1 CTP synthase [Eubacterium coprostanoligenes]MDY5400753.1 CTP synthase [Eubacterium coprostanoligenes]
MKKPKYIFITGGVVSGLGKGITAASLGRLLKSRGLKVTAQKLDPYLNVDPGTMNPVQHGEVFVTDDGAETDLDLGHYERFIDESLSQNSNLTSGRVYWKVISDERKGVYGGQTIQIIPHITNEIKNYIRRNEDTGADVCLVEIGGTIGDIESQPFLEAIRQFACDYGRENCVFIHVTLVPYLAASDELKSKPTQHSVKEMLSIGIQPDIIVCRTEHPLTEEIKRKISLFCNVGEDCVIENNNCDILYAVPMMLKEQKMDEVVLRKLGIDAPNQDLSDWEDMLFALRNPKQTVKIAMVGKYVELHDSYISVNEALKHGGIATRSAVDIDWIDSESLEANGVDLDEVFKGVDGILVPGGFGSRGIEGKILACNYARTHNIPYLGICLGMQIAIIEFARNVLGFDGANSAEIDSETRYPVIDFLPEKKNLTDLGGTLRLGKYPCVLNPESKSYELYGADEIWERHRHRYEVNNKFRDALLSHGMIFAGTSPNNHIVEMIEIPEHPWFVACQFHPEFKSRPNKPHPLFRGFVTASYKHLIGE